MLGRIKYATGVGILLTLGCGPKVVIGHGTRGGGGAGATDNSVGGDEVFVGGESSTGAIAVGGSGAGGPAGSGSGAGGPAGGGSAVGGASSTGPIPPDDGPQATATKVDLLLAVDNSLSMAQKQQLLADAVPGLMFRLVNPPCVTGAGTVADTPTSPDVACPNGSAREFTPVRDMHVGVITSSLGSHGANGAKDVCVAPEDDDHAHLIGKTRDVQSYDGTGFLNWDADGSSVPPGENDAAVFAVHLQEMIRSAGEHGCGYEAQLESVYRFLVDPEPPQSIQIDGSTSMARRVGVDQELLQERANFLRPDSSVIVLMLTDENDCSIQDGGYGWLVAHTAPMYKSVSVCEKRPNDPCCQSCGESAANPGCPPIGQDLACRSSRILATQDDNLNLRCFHQRQRFGFDLLYPLDRYIGGFGAAEVPNQKGDLVPNPLFQQGSVQRDRSLFTLAVIAGVPWQDLATAASLKGDKLEYLTSSGLTSAKRWPMFLGDPANYVEPTDPFMRESIGARSGENPLTHDPIVASSTDPQANPINGHEQKNVDLSDLQYACTFPLPLPITCDDAALQSGYGCDCFQDDLPDERPVCNPPGGGEPTTTQHYGRAFPALRELAVAQGLGRRSVLSSICASTIDPKRSDYGYNPAVDSLIQRVATTLTQP